MTKRPHPRPPASRHDITGGRERDRKAGSSPLPLGNAPDYKPAARARWAAILAAMVFGAAMLTQSAWFQQTASATFDETLYLSCALETVRIGRLDPTLALKGTAPLPVLLEWLPTAIRAGGRERPDRWQGMLEDPPLVTSARRTTACVIGLPLLVAVSSWLTRRRGVMAGILGAGLTAFSPSILAHISLAATDACFALFSVLALAALVWHVSRPSWPRGILAASLTGAAMAAKYSGVFLLPVALVAFLLRGLARGESTVVLPPRDGRSRNRLARVFLHAAGNMILFATIAALFCWALHGFAFAEISRIDGFHEPGTPSWMQRLAGRSLPSPLVGCLAQHLHNVRGQPAFLMGMTSMTGWWFYFPYAAMFKSTPVELFIAAAVIVLGAIGWSAALGRGRCAVPESAGQVGNLPPIARQVGNLPYVFDYAPWLWWSALVAYGVMMLGVRVQIGQRYLLPMYPLLLLIAGDLFGSFTARRSVAFRWGCAVIVGAAVAAQAVFAWMVAPHYLAYFSPLVGGPEHGHRLLGDSNIDWGQDLPSLRKTIQDGGYQRVLLSYFGTATPAAYGIDAVEMRSAPRTSLMDFDCVAVSVNHLSGVYPFEDPRLWVLAGVAPTSRAGYSIMVYDLRSPDIRNGIGERMAQVAAETARPLPP